MGRICAFTHCSNGTYQLERWKAITCEKHGVQHEVCSCAPPFELYPFPTEKKDMQRRMEWIKIINRKDPITKKLWIPNIGDRVCSEHFIDNKKSPTCPDPVINLGHQPDIIKRHPPKERLPLPQAPKKLKLEDKPVRLWDHDYLYSCDCKDNCDCMGCMKKQTHINNLQQKIIYLQDSLTDTQQIKRDKCDQFLKTDSRAKAYTGLTSVAAFNDLHKVVESRASKLQYWYGQKNTVERSREFKESPMKMGRQRKLSTRDELFLVLMKLRLGVDSFLLADIMDISESSVSSIFNTWIKFLAEQLQCMVFWPNKEAIHCNIPRSLSHYKNLRCTIDCSEILIERPRHREIQALTWSEYKKHNTVKFLIGIAPCGTVTYLSDVWGGRASDRHITVSGSFLQKIEPLDLILADRGFTIKEDVLKCMATLEIPPPSSGLEQMTTNDVKKTKRIANARIHVERAICRIKWFGILQNVMPITLLPLVDDILIVCAALCNLLPKLVD